jgi:L-ribulose-5-phosphate 4-epimerase
MLDALCHEVCLLHQELPHSNLVTWTSGNVSGRDPESGLVVIKPSGILYHDLTPDKLVVMDLEGRIVQGNLKPSSDTRTHLYLYRNRPDIHGIVHTHSPFATAFAAVGRPIPAVLTAICDEFGGAIPVGGFAPIGDEAIGQEILRSIGAGKAILLQNHGVFTLGTSARDAVKAAVMVEDAARTVYYALQLGNLIPIPDEMIARLHKRYNDEYGQ